MTKPSQDRPPHEIPDDPEEIEILEIEGMAESAVPAADRDLDILFDERQEAPAQAPPPVREPPRETAASGERLMRLQADFDNLRKRIEREEAEFRKVATSRLVTALLPVLDNFERALASARPERDEGAFRTGVEMIHRQLLDVFRKEGLTPVDALGRPFDPMMHEALATEPSSTLPPNTVIEEIQRGYFLHDRLLRPALVRVSEGAAAEDADPREEP
jgi:molecular chaperone GrpE